MVQPVASLQGRVRCQGGGHRRPVSKRIGVSFLEIVAPEASQHMHHRQHFAGADLPVERH